MLSILTYILAFTGCTIFPKAVALYTLSQGHERFCLEGTNIVILSGNLATNLVYLLMLRLIYSNNKSSTLQSLLAISIVLPVGGDLASCFGYREDCTSVNKTYYWLIFSSITMLFHVINAITSIVYYIMGRKEPKPVDIELQEIKH